MTLPIAASWSSAPPRVAAAGESTLRTDPAPFLMAATVLTFIVCCTHRRFMLLDNKRLSWWKTEALYKKGARCRNKIDIDASTVVLDSTAKPLCLEVPRHTTLKPRRAWLNMGVLSYRFAPKAKSPSSCTPNTRTRRSNGWRRFAKCAKHTPPAPHRVMPTSPTPPSCQSNRLSTVCRFHHALTMCSPWSLHCCWSSLVPLPSAAHSSLCFVLPRHQ